MFHYCAEHEFKLRPADGVFYALHHEGSTKTHVQPINNFYRNAGLIKDPSLHVSLYDCVPSCTVDSKIQYLRYRHYIDNNWS
jgi:hypothetical protein